MIRAQKAATLEAFEAGRLEATDDCAPPLDTKFEATFVTPGSTTKDTIDMSFVDGFTLPFKLESRGGDCIKNGSASLMISQKQKQSSI